MARIDVQSFEGNSTTANVLGGDIFTGATIGTTHVRSGNRAMRISSLSSGTAQGYLKKWLASTAGGPYFLRAAFYVITLPSASNTIMQFNGASGSLGTTARCSITLESNGTLILRNAAGTQVGSASTAINDGAYHVIELKADGTGGTNLKTLEARLDGSIFATSSVQNQGNPLAYSVGGNLGSEAQTTGEWWIDDVALNDSTGSSQTSYPGISNIVRALVSATGDANGFLVQVGGTAGSSNNYTRVNEVPPDDATSYNASAVLNTEDLFTIDTSGVPATATINAVLVGIRIANIAASDSTTGIKAEIIKSSGGTKAQSANIVPNTTSWNTNGTSTPRNYPLVLYKDPDGTTWNPATWTPQIGYIIDVALTRAVGITNIWAEIDYTPASGSIITKTQGAIARIAVNLTKTQSSVGRIAVNLALTQPAKARIAVNLTKTQDAIARIAINHTLTQSAKARIQVVLTNVQTAVARIQQNLTKTQSAVSRISNNFTKTQSGVSRIQENLTKTQPAIGRIQRNLTSTQPAIGRIAINTTKIQSAISRIANVRTLTQSAVAKIIQSGGFTKTQPAVARIAAMISLTQSAISRIQNTLTKTQPAKARIAITASKTQPAVSRISNSRTKMQLAVGRISKSLTLLQTAISRIAINYTKTQPAIARISITYSKTQSATARLIARVSFTQPATANITQNGIRQPYRTYPRTHPYLGPRHLGSPIHQHKGPKCDNFGSRRASS